MQHSWENMLPFQRSKLTSVMCWAYQFQRGCSAPICTLTILNISRLLSSERRGHLKHFLLLSSWWPQRSFIATPSATWNRSDLWVRVHSSGLRVYRRLPLPPTAEKSVWQNDPDDNEWENKAIAYTKWWGKLDHITRRYKLRDTTFKNWSKNHLLVALFLYQLVVPLSVYSLLPLLFRPPWCRPPTAVCHHLGYTPHPRLNHLRRYLTALHWNQLEMYNKIIVNYLPTTNLSNYSTKILFRCLVWDTDSTCCIGWNSILKHVKIDCRKENYT